MRNKILTAVATFAVMVASACYGGSKPSTTTSVKGAGVDAISDAISVGPTIGIGGNVYGGDSASVSLSVDKIKACKAIFSRSVP